jgi:hypothetical protein
MTGRRARRRALVSALIATACALALSLLAVVINLVTADGMLPRHWRWTGDPWIVYGGLGVALLLVLGLTWWQAARDATPPPDEPAPVAETVAVPPPRAPEPEPPAPAIDPDVDLGPPPEWAEQDDRVLRELLAAQAAVGERFPYRLLGTHGRGLSEVYVRQRMNAGDSGFATHVPVDTALDQHRHMLVVGAAGTGKSTLTLRLTGDTGPPGGRACLPLRVTARALAARGADAFGDALAAALSAELGGHLLTGVEPGLLHRRPPGRPWLLIVDGLDEVADPAHLDRLVSVLARRIREENGRYRVVATTRAIPSGPLTRLAKLPGVARYEIAPFTREQREAFADRWFASGDRPRPELAREFLRQADRVGLGELMTVPLLVTVAAVVFENHPGHLLPHSRYELYERYFAHLHQARAESALTALERRLQSWPDGRRLARWLHKVRDDLVDHLALTALAGGALAEAAVEWVAGQGRQPEPVPPDWAETVIVAAASTGLLTEVAGELAFVHHTFAEHRAASARARELPATFDEVDESWGYYLAEARRDPHGHQFAVLAHHAFTHDGDDELLDWLNAGDDDSRILAGHLLAEGVPAAGRQFTAFARTLGFWATTSRDHLAFDAVRVTATMPARDEISAALTTIAENTAIEMRLRLEAVESLAGYGGAHATQGAQGLAAIARDAGVEDEIRLRAITRLIDLGATGRAMAVEPLRAIAADPQTWRGRRRSAQELLARIAGDEPTRPAPTRTRPPPPAPPQWAAPRTAPDPLSGPWDDDWEAWFGRPVRPSARAVAEPPPRAPGTDPDEILDALERQVEDDLARNRLDQALSGVDAALRRPPEWSRRHLLRVLELLLRLGDRGLAVRAHINRLAAGQLSTVDLLSAIEQRAPHYDDLALSMFLAYVRRTEDQIGRPQTKVLEAYHRQGPGFRRSAGTLLLAHVGDRRSDSWARLHRYRVLKVVVPDSIRTARERIAADAGLNCTELVGNLLSFGDDFVPDALDILRRTAGDDLSNCPPGWVDGVLDLSRKYAARESGPALLRRMAAGPARAGERIRAANALIDLGGTHREPGRDALRTIAADPGIGHPHRLAAARDLARLGPGDREVVAEAFLSALAAEGSVSRRIALAAELAVASPASRPEAVASLTAVAGDRATPHADVAAALRHLAGLGPEPRAYAVARLAEVITDPDRRLDGRLSLVVQAARWTPDFRAAALNAVERALSQAPPVRRIEEARGLLDLGPDVRRRMTAIIDAAAAEPHLDLYRTLRAARRLADYPDSRPIGIKLLRRLADEAGHPLVAIQINRDIAFAGDPDAAVRGLARLASTTTVPIEARSEAARFMLMFDPSYPPASRAALEAMLAEDLAHPVVDWLPEAHAYFTARTPAPAA